MKLPIIVVNFKTYPNASGNRALELARIHAKVAGKTGVNIAIAVQAVDLRMITQEVDIPVLAQHFDFAEQGAFTGHITPHSLKEIGAMGSLLNHAERKLPLDVLQRSIEMARTMDLFTLVCADTAYSGKAISDLDPDLVAIEPPELIGGDISVSTAEPQLISDAVEMIGKGRVLVGAGIKTGDDIRVSLERGASGVLIASGVTKSLDPEKTLYDLVNGVLNAHN
jgi:triosephosphate isomerase